MSRDLGPVQRRALQVIDAADGGITVPRLASVLGISDRRARYVVSSLVARQLVGVYVEGGRRRVWSPGRLAERNLREYAERIRRMARLRLESPWCPTCGQTLPLPHPQIRSAEDRETGARNVERGGAVGDDDDRRGGVAPAETVEPVEAASS